MKIKTMLLRAGLSFSTRGLGTFLAFRRSLPLCWFCVLRRREARGGDMGHVILEQAPPMPAVSL